MADWTTLTNTAVGVGGLPSGTTVTALRDNPVAIAEGQPNAPRVQGRSLGGISMGTININSTTYAGWVDCDGMGLIKIDFAAIGSVATTRTLRVGFSNDNGATFGADQNLMTFSATGGHAGYFRLNLQTGVWTTLYTRAGAGNFDSGTVTVPADCNAFRLSFSGTIITTYFDAFCLGGIE